MRFYGLGYKGTVAECSFEYRFPQNWEKQKQAAEFYLKKLEKARVYANKITTQIKPLKEFYQAEDYHKNYFEKNKTAPYCQVVIAPKVAGAREKFESLLK